MQRAAGFIGRDGHAIHEDDVARVEPFIHVHDRHARLRIAFANRGLNGRCTTILRQQRGMNIDAAESRRIEHRLAQDLAIRDHDRDVGLEGLHFIHHTPQSLRLNHRNAGRQRAHFHLRWREHQLATDRFVRLRDDSHDLVLRC